MCGYQRMRKTKENLSQDVMWPADIRAERLHNTVCRVTASPLFLKLPVTVVHYTDGRRTRGHFSYRNSARNRNEHMTSLISANRKKVTVAIAVNDFLYPLV
jgi:hypothetical protein